MPASGICLLQGKPHHSILGALDTSINDLPARTLQGSQEVAVCRPLADDLLQRQVAVREDGLLCTSALAGGDNVHLVDKRRRRITICAAARGRAVDWGSGGESARAWRSTSRRDIVLLLALALLRDERGRVVGAGAESMGGLEATEGAMRARRRRGLEFGDERGGE